MSFKDTIKAVLPIGLFERLKRVFNSGPALYWMTFKQARRYNKAYAKFNSTDELNIATRMTFFTHQIEKGLSHDNFRYGFGHQPLEYLKQTMMKYRKNNKEYLNSSVYQSALAVLREYKEKHVGHLQEFQYAKLLFPQNIWDEVEKVNPQMGGSLTLSTDTKRNNSQLTYRQLAANRHSIREYSEAKITLDEITPAIEIAMHTPSVCNRQPSRIRVLLDPELISAALRIQGGFNGYKIPPALLLITADNRAFMTPQEHNEGFTDGGMFGMSLLLALEEVGLAACPLNTMFRSKAEKMTRRLLDIPNNEELVMYIAVGHFPESMHTCISKRKAALDILKVYR